MSVEPVKAPVPESHANLVWLPAGSATAELFEAMESKGVVARAFVNEGVRVSIGSPEENDLMLSALRFARERVDLDPAWIRFD